MSCGQCCATLCVTRIFYSGKGLEQMTFHFIEHKNAAINVGANFMKKSDDIAKKWKKKKKNVASYYRHCYQSQVFWSKLLIYFIVYVMGMDCTYILSISYYGILHDIIFISYYITVLCMISYSYSHHIIFLCIILY